MIGVKACKGTMGHTHKSISLQFHTNVFLKIQEIDIEI